MRTTRLLTAAIMMMALSLTMPAAATADSRPCIGTAALSEPLNVSVRTAQDVTVTTWDFTGTHDLCLADGTVVLATVAGHLTEVRRPDGSAVLVVHETMSIPTGTLDAHIVARTTPTSFDATAHAFGGTGELAGVTGHGTTIPTGPATFRSEMVYRYPA